MDEKYPAVLHLQAGGRVPFAGLCMCITIMILVYCGARGVSKVFSMKLSTNQRRTYHFVRLWHSSEPRERCECIF